MPKPQKNAILTATYKKGSQPTPANYRLISLLSSLRKLYAKCLLGKQNLLSKISGPKQIGFRKGAFTTDRYMILVYLAEKYSRNCNTKFCMVFLELKELFNSVVRPKLSHLGIGPRLLFLIKRLLRLYLLSLLYFCGTSSKIPAKKLVTTQRCL